MRWCGTIAVQIAFTSQCCPQGACSEAGLPTQGATQHTTHSLLRIGHDVHSEGAYPGGAHEPGIDAGKASRQVPGVCA